jgi:hypothetical protein
MPQNQDDLAKALRTKVISKIQKDPEFAKKLINDPSVIEKGEFAPDLKRLQDIVAKQREDDLQKQLQDAGAWSNGCCITVIY